MTMASNFADDSLSEAPSLGLQRLEQEVELKELEVRQKELQLRHSMYRLEKAHGASPRRDIMLTTARVILNQLTDF
jgi:hypothetical protein